LPVTSRFVDHLAFDCSLSVVGAVKRDMIMESANRKPRRANRNHASGTETGRASGAW